MKDNMYAIGVNTENNSKLIRILINTYYNIQAISRTFVTTKTVAKDSLEYQVLIIILDVIQNEVK